MGIGDNPKLTRRRNVLKAGGTTVAGLLAGCTSDSGNGGTDGGDGGTDSSGNNGGDEYGVDEIESVVPFGSGGFDVYSRGVAPVWEKHIPGDVEITVRNRPGAGGRAAMTQVYNSEPDGSTIIMANIPAFVQGQIALDVEYDATEMPPVGVVHYAERLFVIGRWLADEIGIERGDFEAFQEYASENTVNHSTFGAGGATHIAGLIMSDAHGYNLEFAHYTEEARPAVIQGEAGSHISTADSLREFIEADDFVPIYVTGSDGIDWLPEVPTEEELGLEPVSSAVAFNRMYMVPPGMDEERPDRLEVLRNSFTETVESDELQTWAEEKERPLRIRDHEESRQVIQDGIDALAPYEDLLKEVLGN